MLLGGFWMGNWMGSRPPSAIAGLFKLSPTAAWQLARNSRNKSSSRGRTMCGTLATAREPTKAHKIATIKHVQTVENENNQPSKTGTNGNVGAQSMPGEYKPLLNPLGRIHRVGPSRPWR